MLLGAEESRALHEALDDNQVTSITVWADEEVPGRWNLMWVKTSSDEALGFKLRPGPGQRRFHTVLNLLDALGITSEHCGHDKFYLDLELPKRYVVTSEVTVTHRRTVVAYDEFGAEAASGPDTIEGDFDWASAEWITTEIKLEES